MIAIVSDIHANAAAFEAVLEDILRQGADEIICLGDIIGYGPDPCQCIDMATEFDVGLRGNHEEALMTEVQGAAFNAKARLAVAWTRSQLDPLGDDREANLKRWDFLDTLELTHKRGNVAFCHGSPRDPILEYVYPRDIYRPERLNDILDHVDWICFVGHTHMPGIWTQDMIFLTPREVNHRYHLVNKKTIINVGSVGQPRDGDPRACYVLFDGTRIVYRRVPYRVEVTAAKIRKIAELDNFLAERLLQGR